MDTQTPPKAFSLISIFLAIFLIAAAYFYGRHSVYQAHPEFQKQQQAANILENLSALIQLPTNESPQLVTITDAENARNGQTFLANAVDGDVLVIFAASRQAFLYRPSTNKIIAVGPVTSEETASPKQEPEPVATSTEQKPESVKKK